MYDILIISYADTDVIAHELVAHTAAVIAVADAATANIGAGYIDFGPTRDDTRASS